MYAQIGTIIFDPLAGFNSVSDEDSIVIAQYDLLTQKPIPQPTSVNLRTMEIGMRLHQEFIKVAEARADLKAYKDNGTPVNLIWGNGNVEGQWLIQTISTAYEFQDGLGNIISVNLTLSLLEYPQGPVNAKQQDSWKNGFAYTQNATIANPAKPKAPYSNLKTQIANVVNQVKKYSSIVDNLSYGGGLPNLNGNLLTNIVNSATQLQLLQTLVGGDTASSLNMNLAGLNDAISTASSANNALQTAYQTSTNFNATHVAYQSAIAGMLVAAYPLVSKVVTRMDGLVLRH